MPHRFPQLAPQEPSDRRRRSMAKAMPAPSLRWLDAVIFGLVALILRQF
jgi:hypothetical protein